MSQIYYTVSHYQLHLIRFVIFIYKRVKIYNVDITNALLNVLLNVLLITTLFSISICGCVNVYIYIYTSSTFVLFFFLLQCYSYFAVFSIRTVVKVASNSIPFIGKGKLYSVYTFVTNFLRFFLGDS